MDKIFLVIASTIGIASWNVIIQQKLSKIPSMSLLFWFSIGQVALPFLIALALGQFVAPKGTEWKWIIISWVLLTAANGLYFLAYNRGIKATTATLIMVLTPVFAIVLVSIFKHGFPSLRQIVAVVLAAVAIWLAK